MLPVGNKNNNIKEIFTSSILQIMKFFEIPGGYNIKFVFR